MSRYKAEDYTYRVFWSDEDSAFIAACVEFPSLSNIDESGQSAALEGMVELLQDVLDEMEESGETPPIPFSRRRYSGRISLRITPEQHRRIAIESAEQGVSINQLLVARV